MIKSKPLLSIIIPIYNVEKYLRRSIESIIFSSYPRKEIILVDDGSTDSSGIIADEYAKIYKQVKVIHQDNAGLSAARNTGLKYAKGEFINFHDSDDIAEMNIFKLGIELMQENQIDVLFYKNYRSKSYDSEDFIKKNKIWHGLDLYTQDEMLEHIADRSKSTLVFSAHTKLYRRSVIKNFEFPVGKLHEDIYFTYNIYKNGHVPVSAAFYYVGYFYRIAEQSITVTSLYNLHRWQDIRDIFLTIMAEADIGSQYGIRIFNKCYIQLQGYAVRNLTMIKNSEDAYEQKLFYVSDLQQDVQQLVSQYPFYPLTADKAVFESILNDLPSILLE